jgi:hypothetical protein
MIQPVVLRYAKVAVAIIGSAAILLILLVSFSESITDD